MIKMVSIKHYSPNSNNYYLYKYNTGSNILIEKLFVKKKISSANDNAVYTLDQKEPLKAAETTTYNDADNTTIENPTKTTSAKTLS